MADERCAACGAELRLRPTRCPLCGAEPGARTATAPRRKVSTESYQHDVRKLRAQLKKLRDEGAEAV